MLELSAQILKQTQRPKANIWAMEVRFQIGTLNCIQKKEKCGDLEKVLEVFSKK
jgi:hypothetical protein